MTRARNTVVRAAHGVSAEPLWLSLDFRRSASVRQRFKGENRMPRSCSPCPSRAKLLWQFVGDRGRGAGVGRMSSGGERADRVAREASRVDREDSGLATWDCRRGRNGRRRIPWRVAPIGMAEIRNSAVGGKCGRRDAPAHHGREDGLPCVRAFLPVGLIPTSHDIWTIVETPLADARSYQQSKTQMTLV